MTIEIKNININGLRLSCLGFLLISLGELINHPYQEIILPRNPWNGTLEKVVGHPRNNKPLGILLWIVGLVILGIGIFKLWS